MALRKQTVAEFLAITILLVHAGSILAIWIVENSIDPSSSSGLEVDKIIFPVTAIYAVACANWIIGNQASADPTPIRGVYLLGLVISSGFLVALPFGIYGLYAGLPFFRSTDTVNTYFSAVESAFGAIFVLFFNDLFKANIGK